MHSTESGVVDHLANSDSHALAICRESIASLSYKPLGFKSLHAEPEKLVEEPVYDPAELGGIVGTNLKKSWDMREVIARVVDGSKFHEWKKLYGNTVVTGFGKVSKKLFPFFFSYLYNLSNLFFRMLTIFQFLNSCFLFLILAHIHGYPVGIVSTIISLN